MIKSKNSCFSFFFVIIYITAFKAFPQSNQSIIADSLAKYIEPIRRDGDSIPNYSNLINLLKPKNIVSLGESTHGSKEIFEGKIDIVKGLVETGNFKTIFMETDYCGLIKMNNLIQLSNDTDLYKEFIKSNIYSIYKTKEIYRMFCWVKDYNRTHVEKERISILGMDMQDGSAIANELFRLLPDSGKNNGVVYSSLMKIRSFYESDRPIAFKKQEQQNNDLMLFNLKEISRKTENIDFTYLVKLIDQWSTLIDITDDTKRSGKRDEFMAECNPPGFRTGLLTRTQIYNICSN